MPYCPKCGSPVDIGDRFCANCGMGLHAVTPPATAVATGVTNSNAVRSDYRIILVSKGSCSRAVAVDMLSDLLGYTDADAARIIDNVPMEVALGLTAIQAQYISQAITEYGMEVAIFNADGYVDMGSKATSSVYNTDGSFLSAVAGVLTGLTVSNRISLFNRWTQPTPVLFRPVYRRPTPPPAYRRRRPVPRPTPIPVVHHAPPAAARPAPRPAPTPAPPRSVANSRPTPVGPVATPRPAPAPKAAPQPRTQPGPFGNGTGRNGGTGRGGQGGPMGPAGGRRG